MIIKDLDLKRPIYKKTASFGHFGRFETCGGFTWEKVKDLKHELKKWKPFIKNYLLYLYNIYIYIVLY